MSPATHVLLVPVLFLSLTILGTLSFAEDVMSKEDIGLKSEKLTHIHFYVRDVDSGPNITDVVVARRPTTNVTMSASEAGFGTVHVIDIPLRVGPEVGSKQIGSMQGMATAVSQSDPAVFSLAFTFVFTEGKHKGSTLVVLGWNPADEKIRELPILGGTGLFRFARGYALTSTYFRYDPKIGLAIYEYDLYILHY
ncbi:hypothetical protein MLD38_019548 [Melastoma candidum]|uniref:Uncharacterized protein n=1 Tax=Melastoma candidum TaxID=119954 RepID=A0ACB9QX93_9MYRT|nr:hypothetical protein MLD38_019548 [Melastoma candidum]